MSFNKFLKNKKGDQSVWIIITLVLAVFVALVVTTGLGKEFLKAFAATNPKCPGQCKASCDAYAEYEDFNGDCDKGKVCCLSYAETEAGMNGESPSSGETPSSGTVPSADCKGKPKGTACEVSQGHLNMVCDEYTQCMSKCEYCTKYKTDAICTKTGVTFDDSFKCGCSKEICDALIPGKKCTFGLCPQRDALQSDYACCNNQDTLPPLVTVTPDTFGAIYQTSYTLTVKCEDSPEQGMASGCGKTYYSVISGGSVVSAGSLSTNPATMTIDSNFLITNNVVTLGQGFKGDIYLEFTAFDKVNHQSLAKRVGPIKMITQGITTTCVFSENSCNLNGPCYESGKFYPEGYCIKCINGQTTTYFCGDKTTCANYKSNNNCKS